MRVGDVEADFIVSGKTGKGILLTIVCRKLRIVFIEQILEVSIKNVHRMFKKIEEKLNNRIMECLDFFTPYELLAKHRKRKKR